MKWEGKVLQSLCFVSTLLRPKTERRRIGNERKDKEFSFDSRRCKKRDKIRMKDTKREEKTSRQTWNRKKFFEILVMNDSENEGKEVYFRKGNQKKGLSLLTSSSRKFSD
jgi:hypothetical protein